MTDWGRKAVWTYDHSQSQQSLDYTMTSLRNILLFYWIFQNVTALTVSNVTSNLCQNDYYSIRGSCHPCSLCSNTEILLQPCTSTFNTVCLQCHNRNNSSNINNQYSAGDELSNARHCQNCTNCAQLHRKEVIACSPTQDSSCGGCLDGYFLGVTLEGIVECLACSWCPLQDRTIIRWRECQDAGLRQDMWCSPGYGPPDNNTTSTSYPINIATFMDGSITFQEATGNLEVDSSDSMIVIAFMTLLGTILTICVCFCTLCFCVHRSRRTAMRPYRVLTLEQMTSHQELVMSRTGDIVV